MENPLDRIEDTFEVNLPVPEDNSLEGYLEATLRDLWQFSEDLRETEYYVSPGGKPWLEITDDPNVQESILHFFNEGGEYLLSVEGNVTKGKWRLLDGSNKLIIEKGQHLSELYELAFLNQYFFVLRKHGSHRKKGKYLFLGYEPVANKLRWRDAVDMMYDTYRGKQTTFSYLVIFVVLIGAIAAAFSYC